MKLYKPQEIADQGLLIAKKNGTDGRVRSYFQVLRLINTGKLGSQDLGIGKWHNFVVSEKDIKKYNKGLDK